MSHTDRAPSTYPVRRPTRRDVKLYGIKPERARVSGQLRKIMKDIKLATEIDVEVDQHRHNVLWYWA